MFAILTLLCIPMLVLAAAGNRIENEFYNDGTVDKDYTWFLAIFSVGNLGTDRLPLADRDKCNVDGPNLWNDNGTKIANLLGCRLSNVTIAGVDIPMTTVAQVFQILDVAMVILYYLYCLYFAMRVRKIRVDTDQRQLTVGDYAISVEGIPPETQREDIKEHFDDLYNLSEKYEWEKQCLCFRKMRVPVKGYDGKKIRKNKG